MDRFTVSSFVWFEEDSCILNDDMHGFAYIHLKHFPIVVLVKLCWTIQITNNNENRNWDNLENDTIQTVEMGIWTEKWVSITAEISTKVNNMLIK